MVTETQAMEMEHELAEEVLEECECEHCCECLTEPILFTEDEVKEIIEETVDFIQLDKEVLLGNDEFYDGMIDGMRLAGMYTVLRNAGVSEEKAIELITLNAQIELDEVTRQHELEVVKQNREMQVELENIKSKFEYTNDLIED